jgi:hypothetical protein
VVCVPPDLCTIKSTCAPDTGECVNIPKCREGREVCIPETGECRRCAFEHLETLCSDGCDNDLDGVVDADDPDCSGGGGCVPTVPRCDKIDNDCDALIDEADECDLNDPKK